MQQNRKRIEIPFILLLCRKPYENGQCKLQKYSEETLDQTDVKFKDAFACCVIMASAGYPVKYGKGFEISVPEEVEPKVYYAGAAQKDGKLVTSGGRVLGVTEVRATLKEAIAASYEDVAKITFENSYYRRDIGKRALEAGE